jgi:hypothetical protein
MIAILNYGMGNVGSIANMLKVIDVEAVITRDIELIRQADKLIAVVVLPTPPFWLVTAKVLAINSPPFLMVSHFNFVRFLIEFFLPSYYNRSNLINTW